MLTELESLLEISQERVYSAPSYDVTPPRTRWDAIRQGEVIAELERVRLKLGDGPLPDLVELLEAQGVRAVEIEMPKTISGLFLHDALHGPAIFVNASDTPYRQRFSWAHEYCHLLVDRARVGHVSKEENRDELLELRANAFSAAFLLPEGGIRTALRSSGKGLPARSVLSAFDEKVPVEAQKRSAAGAQDIQAYDVVHLAEVFAVSYEMTAYRLLNLKLITREEHRRLSDQQKAGNIRKLFFGSAPELTTPRRDSTRRVLHLALEAFRRGRMAEGKLRDIMDQFGNSQLEIASLLEPAKNSRGKGARRPRAAE